MLYLVALAFSTDRIDPMVIEIQNKGTEEQIGEKGRGEARHTNATHMT